MPASPQCTRASRSPAGNPVRATALLVTVALLSFGRSSHAGSELQWADGAPRDNAYSTVLVVGVTPDVDQRCRFEEFMASQLTSASTQVIQSCDTSDTPAPPTRALIEQMAKSTGADAVLAAMLVKVKEGEVTGGERDTRGGDYFKAEGTADATGPWGFYDVPVVYGQYEYVAAMSTVEGKVQVTSKLYATQGPRLVCTIDTVVKNVETSDQAVGAVTESIADRLRKEKLVR